MSTQKKIMIAGLIFLPIVVVLLYGIFARTAQDAPSLPTVDWQLLRELNLETGLPSEKLGKFDGTKVRVPGFMVPLEDNKNEVSEFLLVPTPQACIHVPPPPANQMVLVHMVDGRIAKMAFGPVWVEGILRISPGSHMYGKSSFQLMGEATEPYKVDY